VSLNGREVYELNYRRHIPAEPQAPILDIGCGHGEFLEYLERNGCQNLRGVEIDPARVEESRGRSRAVVEHVTDLEAYLRGPVGPFALITLKSVIAHFPIDRAPAYLKAMADQLAPGGTLVVETFNASRWTGPFVFANDITHRWAYTEYSLRQILESSGLRVVDLAGDKRPTSRASALAFYLVQEAWSAVLRAIYFIERGIGRNPTILSKYLVAVCQKAS
jgi:SAM-dependent methyltransferase